MGRILELVRLRNSHPAFDGEMSVEADGSRLRLAWAHGTDALCLEVDLADATLEIRGDRAWNEGVR